MRVRRGIGACAVLLAGLVAGAAAAQGAWVKDDAYTAPRAAWYRDAKYGMFIHWGLYAVPAGYYRGKPVPGIGEWIMDSAKIPIPEYEKFAPQFNPVKFNAREWARVAKAAGMRYMVITSKHHDGFSMFPSKASPYNIVDATPFKRDPMLELSRACKAEGIKFAFYHSIMDWHHPELAPAPGGAKDPNDPRVAKYIQEQLKPQLRELVTKYDPAILWFDGEWVEWWDKAKGRDLEAYLHGLKPDLVINNRVGKRGMDDGDYETPEQEIPHAALGKRLWETCMTLNDTWGYKRDDHNWKQPQDVLRKLADIAGKGGNFLLNVGPTDEGQIPAESVRILEEAGTWLKPNGEAIYGTTYALEKSPAWGSVTRKGNRLYLIVFDWPKEGQPLMLPIRNGVRKAGLLRGKGKVRVENRGEAGLALYLPERPEERYASVVTLQYEGELAPLKSLSERTAAGEPIAAAADGAITLPATGAWVHGKTLKVEQRGGREVLGYWTDRNDYPQWFAQAARPGKHEIALTYACDTGYGGDYTLAIGDQKLTGKSEPTGGWQAFRTVKLGTVDLPAGKVGVTLKPSGAFSQALMNLELVRLTPVR